MPSLETRSLPPTARVFLGKGPVAHTTLVESNTEQPPNGFIQVGLGHVALPAPRTEMVEAVSDIVAEDMAHDVEEGIDSIPLANAIEFEPPEDFWQLPGQPQTR